ncbi:hypothetical protein K466DRAFT_63121 [Polyporus arcularius HHB13444]|uniref:Uncharacterized protein n=1 Tax=Polyporus arcularius HHB13444 TaxID=1314778 RepID=A0A5C3NN86_9APHY|nr:hypothetical protein K466DRAFT_63121 [Polyporus arcularius HHB13444]
MVVELCLASGEKKTKHKGKHRGGRSATTDRALCLFVNAHVLDGPRRCRRHHSNLYYSNEKAPLDDTPCCDRCSPRQPDICCDICHPTEVATMIPVRNDSVAKPQRVAGQIKIPPYDAAASETALRRELHQWREVVARSSCDDYDFYGPDIFLHFKIIDRIVDLVHVGKLKTVRDLEIQTRWIYAAKYGVEILRIVELHTPKDPLPPSPFVTTPLVARSHENQLAHRPMHPQSPLAGCKPQRALSTCGACGQLGHRRNMRVCAQHPQTTTSGGSENIPPVP